MFALQIICARKIKFNLHISRDAKKHFRGLIGGNISVCVLTPMMQHVIAFVSECVKKCTRRESSKADCATETLEEFRCAIADTFFGAILRRV